MNAIISKTKSLLVLGGLTLCLSLPVFGQDAIRDTMDQVVTRFYAELGQEELRSLNQQRVLERLTMPSAKRWPPNTGLSKSMCRWSSRSCAM